MKLRVVCGLHIQNSVFVKQKSYNIDTDLMAFTYVMRVVPFLVLMRCSPLQTVTRCACYLADIPYNESLFINEDQVPQVSNPCSGNKGLYMYLLFIHNQHPNLGWLHIYH